MTWKQCNGILDNDNSCNGSDGSDAELISFDVQMRTTTLEAENMLKITFTRIGKRHTQRLTLTALMKSPRDQIGKMTKVLLSCDDRMLYYKGRCELDSSNVFCSNSALEGIVLRGIEKQKDNGFTGLSIQLR